MRCNVNRLALVKSLKAVTRNPTLERGQKDTYLLMEASRDRLNLAANETEAEMAANIEREGVAFIRYANLLRVVQSYHPMKEIEIAVEPGGIPVAIL